MLKQILVGFSFLILGASALQAQQNAPPPNMQQQNPQMSDMDRRFIEMAYRSNINQIRLGQLAEQKSKNSSVQNYGRQMATDHQQANDRLEQIARESGVQMPPSPPKSRVEEHLATLSEPTFDRQFMQFQRKRQRAAVALYKHEADLGHDPKLKSYASDQLNNLHQREAMMKDVYASVFPGTAMAPRALPRTAGNLPLIGLLGLILVSAALVARSFQSLLKKR